MSKRSRSTAREEQLQLELDSLKAKVELYENQIATQRSPIPDSSSSLSPCWTTTPPRNGRASLDAAMDSRRVHQWPGPTRQRAHSQQDRPVHSMTRSVSNRSDLDMPYLYGAAAVSFTGVQGFMNGSTRAASINGPLASVSEIYTVPDVGVHPSSYLSTGSWYDEQSYFAANGTYLSPDEAQSNFIPSAPPSMVSGISAMDPTQPLTRQNSSYSGSNGANMVRLPSSQSQRTDGLSAHDTLQSTDAGDQCAMSAVSDTDFLAMGSRFSTTGEDYPPSTGNATLLLHSSVSQTMERSISNTSSSSAKSASSNTERRLREALERSLQNGRTKIRPKVESPAADKAGPTAVQKKVILPKTPYQRPKGPKVFCDKCNDYPEGFRGEHELRRHLNAKHKFVVKKYVCRDPATVGLVSGVQALQPLSECKACSGNKKYGAYYNAAAHLRRTHFKPKAPRGKNKNPNDEKRGGKGGGDWPSMQELKLWFKEVHVDQDDAECPPSTTTPNDEDPAIGDDMNHLEWVFDQDMADNASDCDAEGDSCMSSWNDMPAQYQNDDMCGLPDVSVGAAQMAELSYEQMPTPGFAAEGFALTEGDSVAYDPAHLEPGSSAPASTFYSQDRAFQWSMNNI